MKTIKKEITNLVETLGLPYLRISLTKDCNANCFFCHNEGIKFGSRGELGLPVNSELSLEKWNEISKYFKDIFKKVIFVGGEPTLIRELGDIINIFSADGYYTKITSNGFLLDEEKQIALQGSGLKGVNISFHHSDPVKYEQAFRVPNQYDVVLENIVTLSKYFNDTKINFVSHDKKDFIKQADFFSDLSKKYGLLISFLYIIQDKSNVNFNETAMQYLNSRYKLINQFEYNDKSRLRIILEYEKNIRWEFDLCGTEQHKQLSMNNAYCNVCRRKEQCFEGPYALRMTPTGDLKPCLIRNDNIVKLEDYI